LLVITNLFLILLFVIISILYTLMVL